MQNIPKVLPYTKPLVVNTQSELIVAHYRLLLSLSAPNLTS
jgi:hypothetical protein